MMRARGWEIRLVDYAEAVIGRPFAWGTTDCAMLARDAVRALCNDSSFGNDVPRYSTRLGAARAFRKVGGVVEYLVRAGAVAIDPAHRRPGDIIVVKTPDLDSSFVVLDARLLGVEQGDVVKYYAAPPRPDDAVVLRFA